MPIVDAPNLNHLWARLLVEELVRQGVHHFVVSPGSRSTPLTLAVADNPRATHTMHFDERAAGFFALGHAQATRRPVALVCTSGSAVANYLPAVVEASASQTPLVLLTSDRPPELLGCGANQAIDQFRIFGSYTRETVELPTPDPAVPPAYLLTTAARIVRAAYGPPAGPVQVNCMFREPLAPVDKDDRPEGYFNGIVDWLNGEQPYTSWRLPSRALDVIACDEVVGLARNAVRPLLIVGRLLDPASREAAAALAAYLGWPVFPDVCSGLRLHDVCNTVVPYYDLLLLDEHVRETYRPDLVLHLGGAFTSKRLAQHLADVRPTYVHLAVHPLRHDPDHLVTLRLEASVPPAAGRLRAMLPPGCRNVRDEAAVLRRSAAAAHTAALDLSESEEGICEIQVAHILSTIRPVGSVLFLGNSMPVREMDMFGEARGARGITASNRGASGIDGNIATAAGYAHATRQPTIAVVGDLTALHDLNALALARDMEAPFVIVVVNNDGGGIFHFLPIVDHKDVFEPWFGTPHGLSFDAAARMFDLRYACPTTAESFAGSLHAALDHVGATLIEVQTNRERNITLHRDVQAAARDAIAATFTQS
jgi:2-succinyl-5-enolpyruvyl-6-hydroxy-3-cyclohexene-1-carboxylate synthase